MRRNILLVDDDPQVQELVRFFLEQAGFVVRTCKDGYTAVTELSSKHYDLAILDISIPHLNGFDTLHALRGNPNANTKDLAVIMLSSRHEKHDIMRAKQLGADDYIIKPPTREDLIARVERVLGGKPRFVQVNFDAKDEISKGSIELGVRLKAISITGAILEGDIPLHKDDRLNAFHLNILQVIGIHLKKFRIVDCSPSQNNQNKYDYFISFIDMSTEDQQRLRDWIIQRSYNPEYTAKKIS